MSVQKVSERTKDLQQTVWLQHLDAPLGLPEDAGDGDAAHAGDGRDLLVGVGDDGTGRGAAGVEEVGHPLVVLREMGAAEIV